MKKIYFFLSKYYIKTVERRRKNPKIKKVGRDLKMIRITKRERDELKRVGLLKEKLQPSRKHPSQDANFVVVNLSHSGRSKHTYITETTDVLIFLGKWDAVNCLQKIRPEQLNELKQKGAITEEQIQKPHEYKPDAVAFIGNDGQARIYKTASLMKAIGIWD